MLQNLTVLSYAVKDEERLCRSLARDLVGHRRTPLEILDWLYIFAKETDTTNASQYRPQGSV